MNIQKELQINMHQAVVCFDGTDEVGNFCRLRRIGAGTCH